MRKLQLSEMEHVFGGQKSECAAVQALADAYMRDGATNAQWDEWCELYYKHC